MSAGVPPKEALTALVGAQLPLYAVALCRDPITAAGVPLASELLAAYDGTLNDAAAWRLAQRLPVEAVTNGDLQAQQRLVIAWEELSVAWEGHGPVPFRPGHLSTSTVQHCLRSGAEAHRWEQAAACAATPFAVYTIEIEDDIQAGFGYLSAMSRVAIQYTDPGAATAAGLPSCAQAYVIIFLATDTTKLFCLTRELHAMLQQLLPNYPRPPPTLKRACDLE